MKLSHDLKTKITGVLLLSLAAFIGSIPGAMIGVKIVQTETSDIRAPDSMYHIERVCRDTMSTTYNKYNLCHDTVIMNTVKLNLESHIVTYIDSVQSKIDKFQKTAAAYALLRKRAEANLNNHGSVGMRALADEMEIQREMQHILEQDSLQAGLK